MTNTYLIVPINVAALAVGKTDTQNNAQNLAPMADFSRLPWVSNGTRHNSGPYTSAAALENAEPFEGQVPLPQGIHVHWALPDGLTTGSAGADGLSFPSVPNRWLVTRIVVSSPSDATAVTSLKSWVVESDRQSDTSTAPTGLNQPNIALQLQSNGGQNFAYLGQAFDFATWSEVGNTVSRLTPFTALGYGQPTFAAFYPNCSTVFGYYDTLSDLTDYDPSCSTISYHVCGWYSNATDDPLAQPNSTPATYGWSVSNKAAPTSTICTGIIDAVPWNPTTTYLGETPSAMKVAIGASTREAISALMADILQKDNPGQYDTAEQVLNALQFGLLSGSSNLVDSLAAFEEDVHAAGFATISAGSLWSIKTTNNASDDSSSDSDEVKLLNTFAEQLNTLNVTQLQLNDATFHLQSLQFQLFTNWHKYQMIEHAPLLVPTALQEKGYEVQQYLNEEVTAIGNIRMQISRLQTQVNTLSTVLTTALPVTLTLSNNIDAPRYYQPVDPVFILSGPDVTPTDRYGFDTADSTDGTLACRTDGDIVTSVTLAAGLVLGSTSAMLTARALPQLAAQPPNAPAALLQALVAEAFFISVALQPSVAAAVATQGGATNPATLNRRETITALDAANKAFLAGTTLVNVSFAGTAPAALYYEAWTGTPWLPILMQYNVQFAPVQYLDPNAGNAPYAPNFISSNFTFDPDTIDLQYTGTLPTQGQAYVGTTILTPNATVDLANEISTFIASTGADVELQTVLDDMYDLPILAQGLTGITEAFLMRGLTLQMPVGDPLTPPPQVSFVQSVNAAVGNQNGLAPLPEESFNPIRSGLLTITNLRLIDVFGRFKDYNSPEVVVAKGLAPPSQLAASAGSAFLPPRISQPGRLLFRWRAANDGNVETNASPATTPVLGWVIPNYLDNSLQIYSSTGSPLCELALSANKSSVLFTPAPGGVHPIDTPIATLFREQNVDLANFAIGIYNKGDATFFTPFFVAVREALTFSLPQQFAESAQQAVLAGQPLALARANLTLDLAGTIATDESWTGFKNMVLNNDAPSDAGLSTVEFPVVLGSLNQLDDTLVGYWINPASQADYRNFYAPYATTNQGGVMQPTQSTLTLTPQTSSSGKTDVVVLLDPRGTIHATTGILPVKAIDIPPFQYTTALAALELTFEVAPVLSGTNLPATADATAPMLIVKPKVSSGNWSWITTNETAWVTTGLTDTATAQATLSYTPQYISEGWLGLTKTTDDSETT